MKTPNKQTLKQRCSVLEHVVSLLNERLKIVEAILEENNLKQKEDEKST